MRGMGGRRFAGRVDMQHLGLQHRSSISRASHRFCQASPLTADETAHSGQSLSSTKCYLLQTVVQHLPPSTRYTTTSQEPRYDSWLHCALHKKLAGQAVVLSVMPPIAEKSNGVGSRSGSGSGSSPSSSSSSPSSSAFSSTSP